MILEFSIAYDTDERIRPVLHRIPTLYGVFPTT